jgi:hypothetical protein
MNQSDLRQYDCNNMVHCYVGNYINKYASEIYYAFKALTSHTSTKKAEYNILSIGCGDCADLFGINQFFKDNSRSPSISYTGIDMNIKWQPIHDKIKTIFPTINFNYKYQDAFEYVDTLDAVPYNIVILEYVLNEVRKYTPEIVNSFINCLAHKVIDKLPSGSFVVINDINHKMVRDYYPILKKEVEQNNKIQEAYLRFRNPISHTYGGITLPQDRLIFSTIQYSQFAEKFPCSSCIYILFKQ